MGTIVGGGTPSREVPSFWRGSIPWVTPGEVSGNTTKLLLNTNEHISPSGLTGSGANLLPARALMVTTRATLGARVINAVPMATNQGFKSIVFKQAEDPDFYFHLFEKVKSELVRRASGTTFLEISGAEFGSIAVPSPARGEKGRITEILDTLDTAIHETEAIIAKLKAVKQGLLHDLLTRGIDANGELRPPQAEAPHLYKASALGWTPKQWVVSPLRKVGEFMNGLNKPKHAFGSGTRFVNISDVYPDYLDASGLGRVQTTANDLNRFRLEPGDVVMDRSSVKLEGVGYPSVFEGDIEPVVFCGFIIRLRLNDLKATVPRYLCLQMRDAMFRNEVFKIATGGANINVNQAALKDLLIVVPENEEQRCVVSRERAVDERLIREIESLRKMEFKKRGLMDDLLTGRVRVTPLL